MGQDTIALFRARFNSAIDSEMRCLVAVDGNVGVIEGSVTGL